MVQIMEKNKNYVICPGCGRHMGVGKPVKSEATQMYSVRWFCPGCWIAPMGTGNSEQEAIDNARELAQKRF